MGMLRDINIADFGCKFYVETGTGKCVSLRKAINIFEKCFSVDLDLDMVNSAKQLIPSAVIECGTSVDILEKWLQSDLFDLSDSVLFYLDAHFPGADFKGGEYDVCAENAVPLRDELYLIKKYRPQSPDVIICDDARIYMTGPFENGNVEWLQVPGGMSFLGDIFHPKYISLNFSEEGYIIIDRRFSF